MLQPQYRTNFLEAWGNTYGEEVIAQARESATNFWREYQQSSSVETTQTLRQPNTKSKSPPKVSLLTSKLRALRTAPARPQDELTDYLVWNLGFEVKKLDKNKYKVPFLLEWWYQQRYQWPTLTRFAIEILSIAAMSDDVERVFSGARRTISWERAKLGLDKVEAVECLNSWFQLNLEGEIESIEESSEEDIEEGFEEDIEEDFEEDFEGEEVDQESII